MHLDVVDLRQFYYRTRLGRAAQRSLQASLKRMWPETRGMNVCGFGFAAPLLRPFLKDSARVISLMPAAQGVMPWPEAGRNLSVLTEETSWPLASGTADRILVVHGLENTDRQAALLEEIWRVLAPGGLVVFIVPNRTGMWARSDHTPFGHGHPYSFGQLDRLLSGHRFNPERRGAALYLPPSPRPVMLRTEKIWESLGRRIGPGMMAGALFIEATKQVYAKPGSGLRKAIRRPLEVLEDLTGAPPKPVTGRNHRQ